MVILSLRQLNSKIAMVIQIKNLMAFKAMEGLNYDHRIVEIVVWAQIIIPSRQRRYFQNPAAKEGVILRLNGKRIEEV